MNPASTQLAEAQALSTRLSVLTEAVAAMQATTTPQAVVQAMIQHARWVVDFNHCGIAWREGEQYRYEVLRGKPDPALPVRRPLTSDPISRVLRSNTTLLLTTLLPADAPPPEMQCGMLLPLRDGGNVIAALCFYASTPGSYNRDDVRIAYALALQMGGMLQNARLLQAVTVARDELQTVLEASSDAVLVMDAQGRVVLINRALRRFCGLAPEATLSGRRAAALLRFVPRAERSTTLHAFAQSKPHGTVTVGGARVLDWVAAPLATDAAASGWVITGRDVTARVQLEHLRDDLIHMLVHDLRSPLGSMVMSLEMMRIAFARGNAEQHETSVQFAQRSGRRLLDQISTMLDVSKLEAGHMVLQPLLCRLGDVARAVIADASPSIQEQEVQVSIVTPDPAPISGDVALVRRVLENLLGNALKYTPRHGTITLRFATDAVGGVLTEVEDTGPGIVPDMLARIWEKFGQAHQDDRVRGSGLGLTFCKLVLDAHGGSIGVRNAPTGGAIFWFRLPSMPQAGATV